MCPWESGSWLQKTCLRTAQRTWLAQTQVFHWEMIKQLNKKYSNQKNISLCTFRELHHFYYHFTSSHFVTWNVPIGLFSFPFSSLKAIQCHFSTSFLTQWGQKPVFGHGNYYRKLFPQLQIQQMRLSPLPSTMFLSDFKLQSYHELKSFQLYWNGSCMHLLPPTPPPPPNPWFANDCYFSETFFYLCQARNTLDDLNLLASSFNFH